MAGKSITVKIAKAAATTLDKETMDVRKSVVEKMTRRKSPYSGEKLISMPAEVATALPPLNSAKMGKLWPRTANKPKTRGEKPWT